MKSSKQLGERLFIVVQRANAFEENYYAGCLWAENHNDANKKARIKYPHGYLVVEMGKESLVTLSHQDLSGYGVRRT